MSSRLDHRKGREENQRAIENRLRQLNHEIGGGVLTEEQIRKKAAQQATDTAHRAVHDENK